MNKTESSVDSACQRSRQLQGERLRQIESASVQSYANNGIWIPFVLMDRTIRQ
jgi:hypothetical protein